MSAIRFKRSVCVLSTAAAILIFPAHQTQADSKTRQQLTNEMKGYIQQVYAKSKSKNPDIAGLASGGDPKWYGGNLLGSYELFLDFWENLFHNFPFGFLQCFDFKVGSLCWKKVGFIKIPWGFKIEYSWPMGIVETHRDSQDRYIDPITIQTVYQGGLREAQFYPAAQYVYAPNAVRHASLQDALDLNSKSYAPFIPWWGPIVPQLNVTPSSFNLTDPDKRYRYDGGRLGNLDQLEYTHLPSLAHTAWSVAAQYFPVLQLLPCVPPHKFQIPFSSEMPAYLDITRDPWLGYIFQKDKNLIKDLNAWRDNPNVCQEWMMNKSKKNIPFDMFATASGFLGWLPDPLTPLPNNKLSKYKRMCTNNWGGSIPFTTYHQLSDTGFISAGKNLEKATRLGVGIYKTFIKGTGAQKDFRYYKFNKNRDTYQLTYNDTWECKKAGNPGKAFAGADSFGKEGEYGLFSMTHWKRIPINGKCCVSFARLAAIIAALAAL